MKLTETLFEKYELHESSEKLPDGVLSRVTYSICNIGQANANKRVYERAVWDRVLEDKDLKEKIENRALFGHAEHPEQTQSNLEKTSHVIHKMWISEDGNHVYQTMDFLDTPMGRIVDCLLRAGCGVGVSTRAEGDLEEVEGDDGSIFTRVVPESYRYVTTDATADPSTFGVVPHNIKRNIVAEVKELLKNDETNAGEKEFAQLILEAVECKDGKCVLDKAKKLAEKVEEKMKENKTVSNLLEEGIIKEGTGIKYDDKDAKVKKIEEGTVSLTVGDGELIDVVVNGNASVSVSPEGLITILSAEALAAMGQKEEDVFSESTPEELPEEPIDDMATEDTTTEDATTEDAPVEPELDDIDKDIVPESKEYKVGDTVKIEEGEYKNKEGKVTKIEETGIAITLDDGTTVSIEDPSAVNITVMPPAPEEEIEPIDGGATEEEKDAMEVADPLPIEDETPDEEIEEGKLPTKGGVSDRLADGNLLQDREGKYWVVEEITGIGMTIFQPEGPETEKFLDWNEVGDLGFTKISEKIDETADIKAMYKAADLPVPDGKGIHTKAFHELAIKVAKGYVEGGDSPKEALDKAYPTAMKQLGKEKAVKEPHQKNESDNIAGISCPECDSTDVWHVEEDIYECNDCGLRWDEETGETGLERESIGESISTTVKEIKDLKIQEASTRAERDKAIELLEELADEKQQLKIKVKKDKVFEIRMFVSKIERVLEAKEQEVDALRSKLEEKAKFVAKQKKLVSETRTNSLKKITDLKESVAEETKIMQGDWAKSDKKHAKELDQLSETLKVEKKKYKEGCKVLQEKIKKETTAEVTEQFIKSFVEYRLSETNLKVDENSRALLEKSKSLEDVDNFLDEIIDASRRGALHSEAIRGICVSKHTIPDLEGDRITRSVSNVFEGFRG